ncbi:acetyl-CoA acetyltransferase [Mycobacterium kansasii]|uniref:acetyl-CoA acetyltransferase n=1 Tax=Mycobacterium innocens TaxID=2341083 RepID=UPI0007BE67E5|nr:MULTISPECIES: acetyl-CoA acetyltransferase [Mycobacterium]KZS52868.1 acetyl-CoA acetyltransferase [Mycobacterium kansasii]
MHTLDDLDPRTPVIVGVGQAAEGLHDEHYQGRSPIDLAVAAARDAVADTAVDSATVLAAVDTVATTRQFENSTPGAASPLGRSTNFPRSVASRLGVQPRRAVLEVSGGQSPQHLVNEFTRAVLHRQSDGVLLAGAEAVSTVHHFAHQSDRPDFSDDPPGDLEDRGFGLKGLISREQLMHGLDDAPSQYALLENARRAARGESRRRYAQAMGELFEPFTHVAASNPYSVAPQPHTARHLVNVNEHNRMIVDPYPRLVVAREKVNQGAAIVLTSVTVARELGIDPRRWVFLHGQADLRERNFFDRPDIGHSPAAVQAVLHALEVAGATLDDIDFFDFYSCFPIAVFNVIDGLKLAADDPRGLTVTGGLPFFGGPGNNYSMHAIAEIVRRVRAAPGSLGLVGANGGVLSKYSVGIYSTTPRELRRDRSSELQASIDAAPAVGHAVQADGWATVETYTVKHRRNGKLGVVVGRLESDGRRFLANAVEADEELIAMLETADQPVGQRVYVKAFGYGNRVALTKDRMQELCPQRPPTFRYSYEYATVHRDGHLLEVTINRENVRNALHPPANEELAEIFDAYFADPQLWVAILTGAGPEAFCAGNDLRYSASGKPVYVPKSGFAGITHRKTMTKPVIAAVNGFAMGGGLETALACHLIVADENAIFALSEVKVGLVAGAGGAVRLPRALPPVLANELLLTGRQMSANEARSHGLVNRVAPAGTAMTVARELAADILAASPTSVRLTLQLVQEAAKEADVFTAINAPSDVIDELLFSEDCFEGMTAFAQKRQPRWKNR